MIFIRYMKKLIFIITLTSAHLFGQASKPELNIASQVYGILSKNKEVIDIDNKTSTEVFSVEVVLPMPTGLSKITVDFFSNTGKITIISKEGETENILGEFAVTPKQDSVVLDLSKEKHKTENIKIDWVPQDKKTPLKIKDIGLFVSDPKLIEVYTEIGKIEMAAGADNVSPAGGGGSPKVFPSTLPTQYTVSPASLPETRPISR